MINHTIIFGFSALLKHGIFDLRLGFVALAQISTTPAKVPILSIVLLLPLTDFDKIIGEKQKSLVAYCAVPY